MLFNIISFSRSKNVSLVQIFLVVNFLQYLIFSAIILGYPNLLINKELENYSFSFLAFEEGRFLIQYQSKSLFDHFLAYVNLWQGMTQDSFSTKTRQTPGANYTFGTNLEMTETLERRQKRNKSIMSSKLKDKRAKHSERVNIFPIIISRYFHTNCTYT